MKQKITQLMGIISILLGLLATAGWILGIPLLVSVDPEFVTMKITTAICFVLSGAVLLAVARNARGRSDIAETIATHSSIAILLLMGSLLVTGALGITSGLENLFLSEIETLDLSKAGRPGPPARRP